jgi:hypothetical protein
MFKLYFNVSRNFIEQQLVAGKNVVENQIIDFKIEDLDSESRGLLVKHCFIYPLSETKHFYCGELKRQAGQSLSSNWALSQGDTEFSSTRSVRWGNLATVDGSTIEDVIAFYKDLDLKIAESKRVKEEKEAKQKLEDEARGRQRLIDNAKYEAEQGQKKKEQEAKEIQEQAKRELLKTWAKNNGSELLKMRIEEEMNWLELARKEYAVSIMPDGFTIEDPDPNDDCKWWTNNSPSIKILREYKEIKKSFKNTYLKRSKYVQVDYYEQEETTIHTDYIQIELDILDGSTIFAYKKL